MVSAQSNVSIAVFESKTSRIGLVSCYRVLSLFRERMILYLLVDEVRDVRPDVVSNQVTHLHGINEERKWGHSIARGRCMGWLGM